MSTPQFISRLREKIGNDPLHLPTVATMATDDEGRLLLVQDRETGLWGAPGGITEPNELPSDAALRETWEEAGVLVRIEALLGVFGGDYCHGQYANGDVVTWVATVFVGQYLTGNPRPDGREVSAAGFFTATEIASLECQRHFQHFLRAFRSRQGGIAFYAAPKWSPPPV